MKITTNRSIIGIMLLILIGSFVLSDNPESPYNDFSPTVIPDLSHREVWKWRSADGNARIISFFAPRGEFKWRPATLEELYSYKEEFPRGIPDYVYAGASLMYGHEPKGTIPYVTGYVRSLGYGFHAAVTPLYSMENPLHLVIRVDRPTTGRLEYYLGQPETIGGLEIPRLTQKPK